MMPWADVVVLHSIAMAPATLPAMFDLVQYHWLSLSMLLCDPSAPVPSSSFWLHKSMKMPPKEYPLQPQPTDAIIHAPTKPKVLSNWFFH